MLAYIPYMDPVGLRPCNVEQMYALATLAPVHDPFPKCCDHVREIFERPKQKFLA